MCECSLPQWGRWEGGKETEISCMRKMTSQIRDLGREVEDGKGSVGEGKPEVVKRMELRSKRTGGVAEEDMETQQSRVRRPCYGCLLRDAG